MVSNFDCIGLGVTDEAAFRTLIERLVQDAVMIGSKGGCDVLRWQDASGARVAIGIERGTIIDVTPSFAAPTTIAVNPIACLNDEIWRADVMDGEEQLTALAVDLEERRLVAPGPTSGHIGVAAFGWGLTPFDDADVYARADASLLDPANADKPRPDDLPAGVLWPPRLGAESFISYGLFNPDDPSAVAHVAGTVMEAASHTVTVTGQVFHAVRLRTVPGEIVVCLPAVAWDLPRSGQVLAGQAYLVATLAEVPADARPGRLRGWFGRRT